MTQEIYFATNRLSITTTPEGGFTILPDAECGVQRSTLLSLFESHRWVTIEAANDDECRAIFNAFATQFVAVVAAGGVVERGDGSILMIYRNGRWDLPKGHWEEGETIEECAVREVEEESGVSGITLGKEIEQTLHAYYMKGRWEIKRTYWYAMRSEGTTPLTPQREEGIERAEWLAREDVERSVVDSFPTIQDVVNRFYATQSK